MNVTFYLHSEKDLLQMSCEALHLSNLPLQLISYRVDFKLKTIDSRVTFPLVLFVTQTSTVTFLLLVVRNLSCGQLHLLGICYKDL